MNAINSSSEPIVAARPIRVGSARPLPRRRRVSVYGLALGVLLLIFLACFVLPLVSALPAPVGGSVVEANLPLLSPGHLLGTDTNGNDVLSRIVHGGRTSLLIAIAVNLMGLAIGGTLGATSAYVGGLADTIIMRTLDVLMAFPPLILVLAIAQALGPAATHTICALAFFSIPAFARISRASTLRLREQPFMTAAVLAGTPLWRILVRHITPNVLPQLATFSLLGIGAVINLEGAVSYLGLGVPLPQPSWGNMIFEGQGTLSATPALVLLPCAFLFLTVLSFNLLSDRLRARWETRDER
jgi:peptide/nickel transport system permease protein